MALNVYMVVLIIILNESISFPQSRLVVKSTITFSSDNSSSNNRPDEFIFDKSIKDTVSRYGFLSIGFNNTVVRQNDVHIYKNYRGDIGESDITDDLSGTNDTTTVVLKTNSTEQQEIDELSDVTSVNPSESTDTIYMDQSVTDDVTASSKSVVIYNPTEGKRAETKDISSKDGSSVATYSQTPTYLNSYSTENTKNKNKSDEKSSGHHPNPENDNEISQSSSEAHTDVSLSDQFTTVTSNSDMINSSKDNVETSSYSSDKSLADSEQSESETSSSELSNSFSSSESSESEISSSSGSDSSSSVSEDSDDSFY